MLKLMRIEKIANIIKEQKQVYVSDLAKLYSVTEETIRRDLAYLENTGLLTRTYGGALLNIDKIKKLEIPESVQSIKDPSYLLEQIVDTICHGETIILDSSYESYNICKKIISRKLQVKIITNSINILNLFSEINGYEVIVAGGEINSKSNSFTGKWAETIIGNYYATKAIVVFDGISLEKGLMCNDEKEAALKRTMVNNSEESITILNNKNLNKISFVQSCDISDIKTIYTDIYIDDKWTSFLAEKNINIFPKQQI